MTVLNNPIGVFDSGVGGLSVLRAMRRQMPSENVIYFGDQGHVPYGPRPMEQIQSFSEGITKFLLDKGSKLIVVACNTASAAALKYLRVQFPDVPFVGMEPAVKPAAETTQTGKVGILATPATFRCLIRFRRRKVWKWCRVVPAYVSRSGRPNRKRGIGCTCYARHFGKRSQTHAREKY